MAYNLDTSHQSGLKFNSDFQFLTPAITNALKHGGFYRLAAEPQLAKEIFSFVRGKSISEFVDSDYNLLRWVQQHLFCHLVQRPYPINSALMSHLVLPGSGRTYSPPGENDPSPAVPAFFTFVGQFIDHDLTLNAVGLFENQDGEIPNDASPFVDLDSVYGRNSEVAMGECTDIFERDGKFKLREIIPGKAYDVTRDPHGKAFIFDKRNDENQVVLQIHILLMRLHNKLVEIYGKLNADDSSPCSDIIAQVKDVQKEVQRNWQSFIVVEYLPTILDPETWLVIQTEIEKPGFGNMVYKPGKDGHLCLPHEFAISFRMGHSQLRDRYKLNSTFPEVLLFDNKNPLVDDLRGDKPLDISHVIDWAFFVKPESHSNRIDAKVTEKVFDLPESTIPDDVKKIGNLPHRNLIRSHQVALTCGEDLADFLGLSQKKLSPEDIEPDIEAQRLFRLNDEGAYHPDNKFRTPLWYYVLREAEHFHDGLRLGPVGSRIIGEVIYGGIYYNVESYLRNENWHSKLTGSRAVRFSDLVSFL